jgi:uncharacterized LabA/DUF88 family protein
MDILLLLDLQELWNGCRAQFGKRARINFKVLIDKAKLKKADIVSTVAFVALQPDKNQDNLINKLTELGITVVTKRSPEGNVAGFECEMQEQLEKSLGDTDVVVLGSGNKNLVSILTNANAANKKTIVLAFSNTLDKELATEADDIRLLAKQDTITQ